MTISDKLITVVLSSSHRDYGTESDCYFNITNNLLDQTKKYACRVKYIHFAIPNVSPMYNTMTTMFLVINGLDLVDTYYKTPYFPFAAIDCSTWTSVIALPILYEPANALRIVRPKQFLWNIKFFQGDIAWNSLEAYPGSLTADSTRGRDWTMELQFCEIQE